MNYRNLCHFASLLCLALALTACSDDETSVTPADPGTASACDVCVAGTVCNAAGECVGLTECTDTCEATGWTCGVICGMSCGQCGDGMTCAAGTCAASNETETGESGTTTATEPCGGACGEGTTCVDGSCVADGTGTGSGTGTSPATPVCGDGACNGTETCLTCEGDCGACPDNTKWYCYQILNDCAAAACMSVPEAQLQTCLSTELNNCIGNAASPEESTNFSNWFTCLQTCMQNAGGTAATQEDILQCYMYGCPFENAECLSGGTYGTNNCLQLTQCAACANTSGSTECWRPCFQQATADAANDFMAVQLCISEACAAVPVAEQQACIETSLSPGGACEVQAGACEGTATTPPADCDPACAEGETCVDGTCEAPAPVACDPACAEGETCVDGTCEAPAPVACDPACAEGETCVDGTCEAPTCTPTCGAVICADDGCGGVCGACDADTMSTNVLIASFAYSPASISVVTGTTVIWTNDDTAQHNVVSMGADGSVDSAGILSGPLLAKGETFSFTFDDAGSYDYRCSPHPNMTGTVEVVTP